MFHKTAHELRNGLVTGRCFFLHGRKSLGGSKLACYDCLVGQ